MSLNPDRPFDGTPLRPTGDRPSGIRHIVVAVATLMAVLLYLDRFCLSFAVDYIREDLRLTQSDISWLLSAFSWTYALAQVPSGWLSDRYGPRRMLVIYIMSWSFFTAMTGLSHTFLLLAVMRLGIGAAQAGAYPSCGTLLSKWIPLTRRASASSFVAFGGRIGGAIAPLLTAFLIVLFVPLDAPLEFTPDQILDGVSLSTKLDAAGTQIAESNGQQTEPQTPAARVWQLLDDETRDVMKAVAARKTALSEDEAKVLSEGMTALLSRDDLYTQAAFANVSLSKEAEGTAKKVLAGEQVDSANRQRFHRFVLEASFPSELSKLYTRGWRPVMIVYGLAGILVAAIFWFYFRDTPQEHPSCNAAELALIEEGRPPESGEAKAAEPFPLGDILTDFSSWCMCLLQFGTNVGWFFLVSWYPRYLYEVHHVPAITRGFLASIPIWVGMVGLLIGGRLTDWLTARVGLRWGRRLPVVATRFIAAAGYGLALLFSSLPSDSPFQSPWAYAFAFSLVTLGVDMGIAPTWAFMQDVGGKNVGAILGWGNMWGNFGAALAPLLYNRILGERPTLDDWSNIFICCLAACVLSGVGAFGIDATRPLGQKQTSEAT
ncbi:MAG: MFS transporter [Planctomycetaceae bacterium]|nr:MFS transporter [Planctomycetaceae bacterium]